MSTSSATVRTAPVTPSAGARGRVVAWAAVVLVGLLLALAAGLAGHDDTATPADLDPTSTTPTGTRALVRVLRDQGTPVDVVHDAPSATSALATGGAVFIDDTSDALSPRVARRIAATATRVVLVSTDSRVLESFGLRATAAGQVGGTEDVGTAGCPIPAARNAGSMTTAGVGFDVPAGATRCLPSDSSGARTWGLARAAIPNGTVTLLGATSAIENGTISRGGNAAFALDLLGHGPDSDGSARLTWFVATSGSAGAAPSLGDLAPGWVTPVLVTGALIALAGAFWRGRRLGPLVVERLPVVVRAAETTEGRARLYGRTRDSVHALDTLRIGALRRIARRLGLARSSHVDAVVEAAAAALGRHPSDVGAVLVGAPAAGDAGLVAGAQGLAELEAAIRAAQSGSLPRSAPPGQVSPMSGRAAPHASGRAEAGTSTDSSTRTDNSDSSDSPGGLP